MNLSYFHKADSTDVISFPLSAPGDPETEGEVYICYEQAEVQARKYAVSLNEELQRLIVHGILHVLGYDDGTPGEKKTMTALENEYLMRYGSLTVLRS